MNETMVRSVVDALGSDLSGLVAELTDVGIDSILSEQLWGSLPIASGFVEASKVYLCIRDRLFLKKLYGFLHGLKTTSLEERVSFLRRHYGGKEKQLGERLIMLLDSLDDQDKPIMISRLFRAHMYEQVDNNMFFRLAYAVQRCIIYDLLFLSANHHLPMKGYMAQNLYNNGLLNISAYNEVTPEETEYTINTIGKELLRLGFEQSD